MTIKHSFYSQSKIRANTGVIAFQCIQVYDNNIVTLIKFYNDDESQFFHNFSL